MTLYFLNIIWDRNRKYNISIILMMLISLTVYGQLEIVLTGGIQDNNPINNNVISNAINTINGIGTITIKGDVLINDDFVIPDSINLNFFKGNRLIIANNKTLTVNGGINAGLFQIFEANGDVIGNPQVAEIYPEWFGAIGSTFDIWNINDTSDDTNAIHKCNKLVQSSGGKMYLSKKYNVKKGIGFYNGTMEFSENALLRNTYYDGASSRFWFNTAIFIGSYAGFNHDDGVNGETAFSINNITAGSKYVYFTNLGDLSNFNIGDVVYIRDANNYSNSQNFEFSIASHISEVIDIQDDRLRLRDALPLDITNNGNFKPTIRKSTGTLVTVPHGNEFFGGRPEKAILARDVKIINGRFESVVTDNAQVVHVSCHDCDLDFNYIEGPELLGINPCSYTNISLKDGVFRRRAFELAYHHSYVHLSFFKASKDRLRNTSVSSLAPFSISEYGNNFSADFIEIEDEDFVGDANLATVGFLTPYNVVNNLKVNGSQHSAISIGVNGERANNTILNNVEILNSTVKGLNIKSRDVIINNITVQNLPSNAIAIEVSPESENVIINNAILGKGYNSGIQYRIKDPSYIDNNNKYQNVISHLSNKNLYFTGYQSFYGNNTFQTLKSINYPSGTTATDCIFEIKFIASISPSSTKGTKQIKLRVSGNDIIDLELDKFTTQFVEFSGYIYKSGNSSMNYFFQGNSEQGKFSKTGTLNINTTDTDLSFELLSKLSLNDNINLRTFEIKTNRNMVNSW